MLVLVWLQPSGQMRGSTKEEHWQGFPAFGCIGDSIPRNGCRESRLEMSQEWRWETVGEDLCGYSGGGLGKDRAQARGSDGPGLCL